jgi:hypothetical protein
MSSTVAEQEHQNQHTQEDSAKQRLVFLRAHGQSLYTRMTASAASCSASCRSEAGSLSASRWSLCASDRNDCFIQMV